jgi:GMP synthase (glutamine-hydrolysing)
MRSVETQDFLTAEITKAPWSILDSTANKIMEKCGKVNKVYYDITPKPPATVEFE